jgi:two-component system cell cycle sensor histidine kinase/response regulator CckA
LTFSHANCYNCEYVTKDKFISINIDTLVKFWIGVAALLGAIFFLLLSVMDYFTTPENFKSFFLYRFVVAVLLIGIYFVNKVISSKFRSLLSILSIIFSATAIELMVMGFGGHRSTYYVGLIILIICIFGLIPLNLLSSLIGITIVYVIYLFPILLFDEITDYKTFLTSNAFLLTFLVIAAVWRYLNQKSIIRELSLQYDLEQQKKQLETYSMQLKGMVEERTQDLMKSEQWHRSLVDNATDGIIVLDRNGIIVNVNDRACDMHGFSKEVLIGTHVRLLEDGSRHAEIPDRMRRLLEGESLVYESVHHKKDGTPLYLEISSKAIMIGNEQFIQSFYRDITEKKRMQEHLFQSQKMDSIGVLAGGIAHDFNNILTAIIGHAEIIRKSNLEEKALRSLNVIEEASRRAGRMISKLLGFARKSSSEIVPMNVNDVIFDTVKLLERVIDKKISVTVELDNRLPLIQGDINQIEQVLMNLIVNARDAMPNGGKIVLKTTARNITRGMPDIPPYIPEGEYVIVTVTDTGIGIPREVLSKIFEPFFTTKERGKGTGLGLAMVYGVVKEHKGFVTVQSEQYKGSMFTIYLPSAPAAVPSDVQRQLPPVSGHESILVVDDEEDVLQAMQDSLSSHGYKVFAVSDPGSAISIFNKISGDIDLVITDIVMPRINGKELISQIKRINPSVKVLAVSGYAKYVAPNDEIGEINGFLQKPFESYYLLSVVRRILDARPHDLMRN